MGPLRYEGGITMKSSTAEKLAAIERADTERSGTERSGTERSGTERSGTERSGTESVGSNGRGSASIGPFNKPRKFVVLSKGTRAPIPLGYSYAARNVYGGMLTKST